MYFLLRIDVVLILLTFRKNKPIGIGNCKETVSIYPSPAHKISLSQLTGVHNVDRFGNNLMALVDVRKAPNTFVILNPQPCEDNSKHHLEHLHCN